MRNVRDRRDRYYLVDAFQLPSHDVDILENNGEIKRGSREKWDEVLELARTLPESDNANWSRLQALIDINSFIDYYSAQIFIGNVDWPGNNLSFWRYRNETLATNVGADAEHAYTDGRWRWLMYDTDAACTKGPEHDTLAFATQPDGPDWPNPDWSTFLLRSFLTVPEFRYQFVIRFSDLLNSQFRAERMEQVVRAMQAGMAPEMPRHIHRWSAPDSLGHWEKELDKLVACFNERPAFQWQHLQEHLALGLNLPIPCHGKVNTSKA